MHICGQSNCSSLRICGQSNCSSLRRSWSIACRRCSNYIFILNLIRGFDRLGKDNCKTTRDSEKHLSFEIWCSYIRELTALSILHMHQWTQWSFRLMGWCRTGYKSLHKPMMTLCQLDAWEQTSVKLQSKYNNFIKKNTFENGPHFCCEIAIIVLTHCGLMTPNGDIELGHHWFR